MAVELPSSRWKLPNGGVAYKCSWEGCEEIATEAVRGPNRMECALCAGHWKVLDRKTPGLTEVTHPLSRPACFCSECGDEAVTVFEHLDGTALPVCERHRDDLSWVTPQQFVDEPLPGLGGEEA
jgi:hypothetical protein